MKELESLKSNFQQQLTQTVQELTNLEQQTRTLIQKQEQLKGALYALEALAAQIASSSPSVMPPVDVAPVPVADASANADAVPAGDQTSAAASDAVAPAATNG